MNQQELIRELASFTDTPIMKMESIIQSLTYTIVQQVSRGNDVKLAHLGTFTSVVRKKRKGRNPQTGEDMIIPETIVPKFRASQNFKDEVG